MTKTVFITTTGAGSWTVPQDWNSLSNTIRTIGAGGGGAGVNVATNGGGCHNICALIQESHELGIDTAFRK